jgi:hypothetical protein
MERMAWTDERLEGRFNGIDRRFDETNRRFDRIEGQLVELRQGMGALQTTLNRAGAGIILSLIGVIAAILAKGV